MTVYVDDLHNYGTKGNSFWCHMWATDVPELLAMAKVIGLQKAWIQTQHQHFIHFDLSSSKRELALKAGAEYKPLGEWIRATYPKFHQGETP